MSACVEASAVGGGTTWGRRRLSVGCPWCFAGGDGEWLCSPTFPVSPEAPAGTRTLVLFSPGKHDHVFLLQKCCKPLLNHLYSNDREFEYHIHSFLSLHFVPTDVCGNHLLVSVLLWILWFCYDWPVVSHLLQLDVFCLSTTHHWHSRQRRVSRDAPTTTSGLH